MQEKLEKIICSKAKFPQELYFPWKLHNSSQPFKSRTTDNENDGDKHFLENLPVYLTLWYCEFCCNDPIPPAPEIAEFDL